MNLRVAVKEDDELNTNAELQQLSFNDNGAVV